LFLPADVKYSPVLEKFIKTNSRLRNTYTTGSDGRRVTLPEVKAGQTLLVVGDSVAFGMGVDDADTIPSQLQQMLGERMRVVNGGVGGYNFEQCIGMAALLAKKEKFAGLVYLACQNDFHGNNGEGDWAGASLEATERLSHLKEKFGGKVVVVLEEYLEYVNPELPAYQGWPREWLDKTDRLRETLDKSCREKSFVFRDWKNAVESYNRREKSLFADFGLYVDHCHLSPRGCRMMAELIYGALGEAGITEGIK
jgi:lysophospholipase L1-like esterase